MKPTAWEVIGLNAQGGQIKSAIKVTVGGADYIFRYAYDEVAQAREVMGRLQGNFGRPAGVDTDLAINYWMYSDKPKAFRFARMTTMRANWHVLPASSPRKPQERQPPIAGAVAAHGEDTP